MTSVPMLVLAGGLGTRLAGELHGVPKALAPVGGRPFLAYLVDQWASQGVTDIAFLIKHQAEQIRAFLDAAQREGSWSGLQFRYVTEPELLGTGGAVANAVHSLQLRQDFLVTNSDTWVWAGVSALLAAAAPAIGVVRVEDTTRFGSVSVLAGRVSGFAEKSAQAKGGLVNAGVYRFHARTFAAWPRGAWSLERDVLPALVAGGTLAAVELGGAFIDIGVPEDYRRFVALASHSWGS